MHLITCQAPTANFFGIFFYKFYTFLTIFFKNSKYFSKINQDFLILLYNTITNIAYWNSYFKEP